MPIRRLAEGVHRPLSDQLDDTLQAERAERPADHEADIKHREADQTCRLARRDVGVDRDLEQVGQQQIEPHDHQDERDRDREQPAVRSHEHP
jgi:hypothetical protein